MKYFSKIVFAMLLCVYFSAQASITFVTGNVNSVRVQHWNPDIACIKIGDKWFKLDLNTASGKSSYSLALTAFAANRELKAKWLEGSALVGGCDTGTTVHPLYNIEVWQ